MEEDKIVKAKEEHMRAEDKLAEILVRALERGMYVNVKTREKFGYVTLILKEQHKHNPGTEESLEVMGRRSVVAETADWWLSVTAEHQ